VESGAAIEGSHHMATANRRSKAITPPKARLTPRRGGQLSSPARRRATLQWVVVSVLLVALVVVAVYIGVVLGPGDPTHLRR
jgi:hypothetical protein